MEFLSIALYLLAFGTAVYAIRAERKNDLDCAASFDSVWNAIEDVEDRLVVLEPKKKVAPTTKKKKGA